LVGAAGWRSGLAFDAGRQLAPGALRTSDGPVPPRRALKEKAATKKPGEPGFFDAN